MTARKELEYLLQQASRRQLMRGSIDRREFLTRSLVAGLGLAGVGTVAKTGIGSAFAQDRPFTPTFYQWIEDNHPGIPRVNEQFPGINYQIAPVEGFGIERFVAEAKNQESTWDVYVGQTPFVEMSAMIAADVTISLVKVLTALFPNPTGRDPEDVEPVYEEEPAWEPSAEDIAYYLATMADEDDKQDDAGPWVAGA